MNSFTYQYPVKNYFGEGALHTALAAELPAMGEKVMLAYGGGSIKRTGLYDEIVAALQDAGKTVVEFPGIMPNPTYEKVQEGARIAREEGVDFILAVGGGSVFDCCKIVSAQVLLDEDIDDFSLQNYAALLDTQIDALEQLLSTCQRGQIVRNGVKSVILGRPNAGKSSLLNALAGYERVIVTDIPGTTRDTVEEKIRLGGLVLRLIDTAGIRDTRDAVEQIGVTRALEAAESADLALLVLDGSQALTPEDFRAMDAARSARHTICILGKADLPQVVDPSQLHFDQILTLSAKTGQGIDALEPAVAKLFSSDAPCDGGLLTNARHISAITRARDGLKQARISLSCGETPDAVLMDVEDALSAIGEVTGRAMREDITADIFSRFCVGK